MKNRILSWGLILSLLLPLLPVSAVATEGDLSENGQMAAEAASEEYTDAADSSIYTVEDDTSTVILDTPTISCTPLDEENSSDMVLTVEGEWDSYLWESCAYGLWSDWAGDGPSLILSKEDFTSYGFRCTVTRGEQSVTSEPFAYDPSVLEPPMMVTNSLSDDALYGSSDYMKFGKRLPTDNTFNIKGLDNGYEIQTTYADAGYRTAISVNGGTKRSVFYKGEPASVGNSLTAETSLEIVYGGRYVKVTYEVKNNGSTTQNFRIGSSADVMIDNNDHAKVVGVKSGTGDGYTGLSMDGSPKNNYKFSLVAPDCDTLWYGYYSKAYINIFNDLANKDSAYSKDSGMAWSWNGSVAPGQTWRRFVLIGAGDLPPAPDAPQLDELPDLKAGEQFTISGTVNLTGNPPDTVHISIGGKEYEARVDENGTFTVTDTLSEDIPAGETTLTYWGTTDDGGISEIQSESVSVEAAPFISLTTSSVTVTEGDTGLDEAWLNSFIKDHSDTVTISPTTIDTNTSGDKVVTYRVEKEGFTPATSQLTVTVLPKPAELTQATVSGTGTFNLSSTMAYTGGLTYKETGFVYGTLQNPTLTLNDGKVTTDSPVNTKGGQLTAAVSGSALAYGVNYYARAYAIADDGTVIYSDQSTGFGVDAAQYGVFSVTNSGNTFTITRSDGTDGAQTVYYRTVNGSAIGGTHFEHKAGSVTFAVGEKTKSVSVTEKDVFSIFGGNAATAYSNADRTYSFEIYRVSGGATINSSQKSATRTMTVSSNYHVDGSLFNEYRTSTPSGETARGDYEGAKMGWTENAERVNAKEIVTVNSILPASSYASAVSQNIQYKLSFQAKEVDSGYQHIQISSGEGIDLSQYPYEGTWKGTMDSAVYAAIFEHGGDKKNETYASYTFPNLNGSVPNLKAETWREENTYKGDGYIKFPVDTEKLTVGFAGSGSGSDEWTTKEVTHYLKYLDTEEPQLLGVAPMADGSYLPGDSVTVALVFDEVVDSAKSPNLGSVQIVTNWGTFTYTDGADTNVLYFTGTVSDTASGTLTVESITNAENIKDMAEDTGTATGGTVTDGDTDAALGNGANAPTVTVSQITNANGMLTGTITATNAAKLEYAWSTEADEKAVVGWKLLADTSGGTVSTRQTSGTWYLHARATNNDGVTDHDSRSVSLEEGGGTVELPSLTVTADNANWAKSRPITVTRSPANATVQVKTPDGASETVSGSTYTATQNGTYTFTLGSGDDTITKMVTVSKLDTIAPAVDITDLSNQSHTEAVTLTVRVSDGESGIQSVTGMWSNGGDNRPATISGGSSGVYTTTSPDESGTWTLTVTATDNVGNSGTDTSLAYTINATRPGLTVTKQSESSTGVVYHYSVTENGNTDIIVTLPDGSITTNLTGTFTIAEPGDYVISVTDAAGHFVSESFTVDAPQDGTLDGVAPDVRLSIADENWTKDPVTVAVEVYDVGSAGKDLIAVRDGSNIQLTESVEEPGSFSGSFEVSTNGTYTVTCTDAAGNEGSGSIDISNIDTAAPTISVSGNPTDWTADDVTITLDVTDDRSGVNRVEVKKAGSDVPVAGSGSTYTFTTSENGTYIVTVTDKAGNTANETVVINKIDNGEPTLAVSGGMQSAASLHLTVTASAPGDSGVKVTVRKDGGEAEEIQGNTYSITSAGTYIFTAATGTGKTAVRTVTVHSVTIGEDAHLVADGGKVTKPAEPTKAGYIFAAWYDGNTLWDFETGTVTRDLSLAAKWTLDAPAVELTASPESASGAYNGGSPVVTLTAEASHKAGTGVTYTYEWYKDGQKLDGKTAETLALSTVADSGEYTVKVSASADGQNAVATSNAVTVTISKADPRIAVWPTASDLIYGDSLSQSALTGGNAAIEGNFAWKDSAFQPNSGSQSCTVVFTPDDRDNYNTVEQSVTVTVAKRMLDPAIVSVSDKEYDGNAVTSGAITLTGAVLGETPTATGVFTFDNANAGPDKAVTVAVTLDGNWGNNYALSTNELTTTATITTKTVGLEWQGYENLSYTGQPVSVIAKATGLVTGDTCTVIVEDGDKVDVGNYTAKAIGLSNPNYQLPTTGTTKDYTIAMAAGSASVTMESWIYGDAANSPVPVSDTNGTDKVTYHYDGRNGTAYSSDIVPTNAGDYTVTATFAATENHEAVTAAASFTIEKKPIAASWLGLNQVYGSAETVTVSLVGVVDSDDVKISFTGVKETAGRHLLTATLTGTDITNYTLKNSTAMLTIQPRPVIFSVTDNTVQADGSEKRATITADDAAFTDFIVTYRQNGKEVSAPKDVGSYEIWVEITNPNYRHTDGGSTMQVGTLAITQAPPVLYTASFAGGEGATGDTPATQTTVAEGQIILPANPFTLTDYCFSGWKADGDTKLYQPGECFTMPERDVTFTAQWQEVYSVSGIIKEQTDSGEQPAEGAVVSIWLGANQLAEYKTGADGSYSFSGLLPGVYNLVVTKDVRTVTSKVEITMENESCDVTLPKGATNSVVEVIPGSPDIVVGKLDTVFDSTDAAVYTEEDQKNVNEGGKVEITFTAAEKQRGDDAISSDMDKIAAKKDDSVTLGLVMDYKLEKTVTTANGDTSAPTLIPQANVLLEILLPLPAELQGKDLYSVYRVHSSTGQEEDKEAQELKQGEANKNELGEYFTVNSDKTRITLYVKCFSTYAIGYADATGSSGGGSSSAVYPPDIEQTEHGSVTISPKNPEKGDQVTITPAPDDGYTVDEVVVTDSSGKTIAVTPNEDGTYTFTQPDGKVTITVTFRQMADSSDCPRDESCPMAAFADTELDAWYHDGVHYCLESDLMVGTSQTTFEPDAVITRGMIVTILWRLEGSPIVDHPMVYDDVNLEDWYGDAVRWADSIGVVTGYGNNKFGPNDPITREQMAAMLWRYAGSPDADGSLSDFADGAQTSDWAQPAMIWAVAQELLTGVDQNQLEPQGQATRAQAATILMRFAQNMKQ